MNRNSQNRQYPQNYSGYTISNAHQQTLFSQGPPLGEGSGRFQQTTYNGRVVQNQGQATQLNSGPVPGAPAARFDGQLPFHGAQGAQQWIAPQMLQQHNIGVPPGQHGIPQARPVVYPQQIQSQQHWGQNPGYVPYPMPQMPRVQGIQTTPQPSPYQSGLQQQYPQGHPPMQIQPNQHIQHLAQPQMTQPQRHVQQMNTSQAVIPGTQTPQYTNTTVHHSAYTASQSQTGTIPKRVPKPLVIVDPKTNQPVDLKESNRGANVLGSSVPVDSNPPAVKESTPEIPESSVTASTDSKSSQGETSQSDTSIHLNAAAQEFFPHTDAPPDQPCNSSAHDADSSEKSDGVKMEENEPANNLELPPVLTDSNTVNHETKSDSADTHTPLTTPEVTDLDEPERQPSDVPAADETVSEEAANLELKEVEEEIEETIQETDQMETQSERCDEKEVTNGDAACEQSDNDVLSQEDSGSDTCASPISYNFKVDTAEAPATTENRKRHYDRNYLINLQRCKAALRQPTGLPEELIEQGVILKTASPLDLTKPLPALKSKGMDDFTPEYARNMQAYRGGSRYRGDGQRAGQVGGGSGRYSNTPSGQRRGSQQSARRIEPVRREPIKIHTSENAYVPQVLQNLRTKGGKQEQEESEEDKVEKERAKRRRICFSHLNKLTPQNSDVIFDHIRDSGILCHGEGIDEIASCIFKKAVTEPPYSVALADLVAKIMGEYDSDEMQKHKTFFKQNLLSRCQTMFETDLEKQVNDEAERMRLKMEDEKDLKIKAMLNEEIEEAKKKVRSKYYGNIKFVGELYLRGLVGAKTIHDCVAMLLQHKTEESIESVCKFLETTGAKLDQGQATSRVDHYFNRIVKIKDKIDNQRLKFKLADLIDMRNRGWKLRERAAEYQVRPRTRAELEKERIEEENKKQAAVDKMVARKREEGRYGARGGSYSGRPSSGAVGGPGGSGSGRRSLMQDSASVQQQGNPDGWKTVPSRRVDPRTLTLVKDKDVDGDVKLGPSSGLTKWTQGCRTKGRDGGDRVSATKNMGRQNLSPSPRNSANSSRRGSNSNIPASVGASASQRDPSSQNREELDTTRNGVPGTAESVGASSGDINERPPPDGKLRNLVENKCKHIYSEYSAHKEFDFNAFEPIKLYGDVFVESLVGHVIELSKVGRIEAGHMMLMMLERAIIRADDISDGFKPHFEAAADILMDVPKFYTYVAEILSGMVCDEVMCTLPKIMEPLDRCPEVSTVIAEMLHLASGENGHDKIGVMFRSASLDWHIFLNESTKMDDFIKKNKLEFTLTGGVPKVPDCCVNLDDLERQLHDLVCQRDLNKEDVFSLLETTVDKRTASSKEFVDMVVRTITGVAVKTSDFDFLHDLCPVLRHVIGDCSDQPKVKELMLQALFAIQKVVYEIQCSPQSIIAVFDVLSDNHVINDQAFMEYYNLKPSEATDGYDFTIHSTANFYATLMST